MPKNEKEKVKINIDTAQTIVKMYDEIYEEIKWITDQDELNKILDQLFDTSDLEEALESMILYTNINVNRRLQADKEEKKAKKLIARLMTRLWKTDFVWTDWIVSWKPAIAWEYIEDVPLPADYMMPSRNTVNSAVQKWINLPFVKRLTNYFAFTIK